ncbi:hypothetical protein C1645_815010 [Glomus cerebriforme]|uniref:Uncharacterized protein n=1 Tax=Glomus cerebriforme TaxID=658196 RepID=A0A397TNT1_9GLOM|nr:hypothetical protein C1645_815010 [Glomus cerebriforme]
MISNYIKEKLSIRPKEIKEIILNYIRNKLSLRPIEFYLCKLITIVIFLGIILVVLVVLSIGVFNDLPTVTFENSQIVQFPAPVISMQLAEQPFIISCNFLKYDYFDDIANSNDCLSHITQPTLNPNNGLYTGKFSPNGITFPDNEPSQTLKRILFKFDIINDTIFIDGSPPVFTINIFDSTNLNMANAMYNETIYHIRMNQKVRKVLRGSFRNDLGLPPIYDTQTYTTTTIYPTTRNSSYFETAASGFMIDPVNFVAETQTDQRNKNFLSVISNVLAVGGFLLALYTYLFGVKAIKRWGFMDRKIFKDTTLESLRRIGLNPESLTSTRNNNNIRNITSNEEIIELLNEEINVLKNLLKHIVDISWLSDENNEVEQVV